MDGNAATCVTAVHDNGYNCTSFHAGANVWLDTEKEMLFCRFGAGFSNGLNVTRGQPSENFRVDIQDEKSRKLYFRSDIFTVQQMPIPEDISRLAIQKFRNDATYRPCTTCISVATWIDTPMGNSHPNLRHTAFSVNVSVPFNAMCPLFHTLLKMREATLDLSRRTDAESQKRRHLCDINDICDRKKSEVKALETEIERTKKEVVEHERLVKEAKDALAQTQSTFSQ